MNNRSFFCGPLGVTARQFLPLRRATDSASSWFAGDNVTFSYRARTAISYLPELLEIGGGEEVMMPAYNCGSEIDSFIKHGISVVLFRVDAAGRVDVEDIKRKVSGKTKAIYVIHYFGFPQDLAEVHKICKQRGLYLIEDCALSLFSSSDGTRLGHFGDVAVMSFPKSLPLPDGGALIVNNQELRSKAWAIREAPLSPVFRQLLPLLKASVLRYLSRKPILHLSLSRISDLWEVFRSRSQENLAEQWRKMPESYYHNPEMDKRRMSFLSRWMLDRIDYAQVVERRRNNYQILLSMFSGTSKVLPLFRELPRGVCPLVFPVVVADREKVCIELNRQRIHVIPWWAGYHRDLSWDGFEDARFLKDHVLALPIHQDLSNDEVNFIGNCLLAATADS